MEVTPLLNSQVPASIRHRLITVEPLQFLFIFYYAGSVPVTDQFVQSLVQRRYNLSVPNHVCGVVYNDSNTSHSEAEASAWLAYMSAAVMVCVFDLLSVFSC